MSGTGTELVILIGLQASGKSTFYRRYLASTHTLVSKDQLRNNRRPARRQAQLIEAALQEGQSVVVDNTNPTVEERAVLIELGRRYGARIAGYYVASGLQDCLERNRGRAGRARVPDVALYATIKRLAPPAYAEGFDQLFHVRPAEDGAFTVTDWIDEEANGGQ